MLLLFLLLCRLAEWGSGRVTNSSTRCISLVQFVELSSEICTYCVHLVERFKSGSKMPIWQKTSVAPGITGFMRGEFKSLYKVCNISEPCKCLKLIRKQANGSKVQLTRL